MGVEISDDVVRIYAPVVVGRKGEYYQLLYDLLGKGFEKAKIDGTLVSLRDRVELSRYKKHDIDALVDEILISEFQRSKSAALERLSEAVERALQEADGLVKVEEPARTDDPVHSGRAGKERIVSTKFMCAYDGFSFPEVEPRLFSFNSQYGACPACNGLGTKHFWSEEPCPVCKGARLRPEALNVFLGEKTNVVDVTNQSIATRLIFLIPSSFPKKTMRFQKQSSKRLPRACGLCSTSGSTT